MYFFLTKFAWIMLQVLTKQWPSNNATVNIPGTQYVQVLLLSQRPWHMEVRFFHLHCSVLNMTGKSRMHYICNSVHNFYTAIFDHHQHHVTLNVFRQLLTISTVYIQQFSVHSKAFLHSAYNPKKGDETDSTHHKMYYVNQFCSQCVLWLRSGYLYCW